MAIYNAVKKRMNADGSKALVNATFPVELQDQIKGDFGEAAAVFAAHSQLRLVRAAKVKAAAAAAAASEKRRSWFFGTGTAATAKNAGVKEEEEEEEEEDQEQDDDHENDDAARRLERPGTPAPTVPSPVSLGPDEATPTPPKTILGRLSLLVGANSGTGTPPPTPIDSAPHSPPVKFDAAKAVIEGSSAILLLWAVSDALKKAAKARQILDDGKLQQAADQEQAPELVDESDVKADSNVDTPAISTPSATIDTTVAQQQQSQEEAEADAAIGKTEREREMQLLSSLNNESLVSLVRAIQAILSLLRDRFLLAGVEIKYHDPIVLPVPAVTANAEIESVRASIDSSATIDAAPTTPTKESSKFFSSKKAPQPPLSHDLSKYPPVLINKLKLGWGPVGMILECTTREEIVELLERSKNVWESQEKEQIDVEVTVDGIPVERLFLIDAIINILRERGTVVSTEIDWL
ncbi:UNVERIFIED_CONTAM: hypothetical protein HDU68_004681 [Siphonaria sp. JEL0065]|nr:hypothetical protein HDU68_004681 [Siphonaria sp. JEL0065]